MPRALITGITGQDGSYLAEFLLEKGYKVYGLVRRLSTPNVERISHILECITLVHGDLLDQSSLTLALEKSQPDEVYNLAAQSHVGLSFEQPVATGEYNALGTVRLLEAIRLTGAPIRFYQASTSEMFGNCGVVANEETPFAPVSPYAISKLHAHLSVGMYRDAYNMYASCGILFNHESPRRGLDFVTRKITDGVARIKAGLTERLELGNLTACRDWGYAGDYVEAMWLMLQQEQPDDYVIATGISTGVWKWVEMAFERADIYPPQLYIYEKSELLRPSDIPSLVGDASKAQRVLGWQPRVTLERLIQMMVDYDLGRYNETRSKTYPAYGFNRAPGMVGL